MNRGHGMQSSSQDSSVKEHLCLWAQSVLEGRNGASGTSVCWVHPVGVRRTGAWLTEALILTTPRGGRNWSSGKLNLLLKVPLLIRG